MGLFGFGKSKEQKERDEVFRRIQYKVFPGGTNQIKREVKEVRERLNFKYTLDEVRRTYIYAATLYFLTDDNERTNVINSILYDDKSVVTREDAIYIYNYLNERNEVDDEVVKAIDLVQEASNEINRLDKAMKLMLISKGGIVYLKRYRDLTDHGKFEVILFNSLIALGYLHSNYPKQYSKVEEQYFKRLTVESRELNIPINDEHLINFINARFQMYSGELELLLSTEKYMPGKLYSAFYEKPLAKEPQVHLDITQVVIFSMALSEMMEWVDISLQKI